MKTGHLAFLFLLLLSLFFLVKPSLSIWSSPLLAFNATPNTVYLNWTNNYQANVTITSNDTNTLTKTSNITIEIYNTTRSLTWNYSQFNDYASCLNNTNYLIVQNATAYSNVSGPINGTSTDYTNVNLTLVYIANSSVHPCSPGRYWIGNLTIGNYTNSTEQTYVSVILDIPISQNSSNNPLSNSTGAGSFGYSIMPANATQYQSYFFNATSLGDAYMVNATSVLINMTGWPSSQDVDMFLFDNSGDLKAKSINKNTSEQLVYGYLPSANQMWEIRAYGNTTNISGITYSGKIIFNTLNMTNASNADHRINLLNFTSAFGTSMNSTNMSIINVTLKNEGNINLTNVAQSIDLYHVEKFALSGNQNISIVVPNSTVASKLKVILNWTGASNYSFDVYNPAGSLVMVSKNKYNYANITGAMQEEYNETTSIGNGGYWRVEIKNNTAVANDAYTLTSLVYVNASKWISTNFTNFNFNNVGLTNSTYIIQYNLTVQNDTLDGKYEGYAQYRDNAGSALRIPIEVLANTSSLIVNNSFQSSTFTLNENIGANLTRVLNITYNNTGSLPISISHTNSSGLLYLSSSNSKNITFTYEAPETIPANGSGTIDITININTTNTSDTAGTYEGWIFLTATDSHPCSTFNLTLRVSLSTTLTVTFLGATANGGGNTTSNSSAESVLFGFDITYINGTALENPLAVNSSDISSVWLSNINVSHTVTLTNISNKSTTPVYCISGCDGPGFFGNDHYYVNATVPANSNGGIYDMGLTVSYIRSGITFSGSGLGSTTGKYLVLSNSGLHISYTNASSFTLQPTNTTRFHVNVTNYGPVASNATFNSINFTESCSDYSISGATGNTVGPTGCSATYTDSTTAKYNITVPGNSSCIFWWTITAESVGNASTCTAYVRGNGTFFNPEGLSVPIIVSSTTSSTTTTTTTTTPTATTLSNMEFTKADTLLLVQQNSSNYTDVGIKNTGSTTLDVTLSIDGINSTWYSMNATNKLIGPGVRAGFKITFNVGSEEVKDYAGTYKASSATKTITQNFTLRIMPAPATQSEINDTLAQYKLNMTELEAEINKTKESMNITVAEQKLAELKSKIAEAENYINLGDYFNANRLLESIKTLIDETKTELSNAKEIAKQEGRNRMWVYVGIGAAVVLIGVAAYLFWPTKGTKRLMKFKSIKPKETDDSGKDKDHDFEKLKDKYKK